MSQYWQLQSQCSCRGLEELLMLHKLGWEDGTWLFAFSVFFSFFSFSNFGLLNFYSPVWWYIKGWPRTFLKNENGQNSRSWFKLLKLMDKYFAQRENIFFARFGLENVLVVWVTLHTEGVLINFIAQNGVSSTIFCFQKQVESIEFQLY